MNNPVCFVEEVTQPVQLITTGTKSSEDTFDAQLNQVSTIEQLRSYINDQDHSHCIISVCQRHSWGPLHITQPMLESIVERFDLSSSVWDLSSCFYNKYSDIESTVCIPFTLSRDGPITEAAYTIRYPELKPNTGKWVIRQTGIYQKFNVETCQSLIIIFNPLPDSKFYERVKAWIFRNGGIGQKGRFWIHEELFHTYLLHWRHYNAYLEGMLIPIANNAVTSFIEDLTETEYHHLSDLAFLESRLIVVPDLLAASDDVLTELISLCQDRQYNIGTRIRGAARKSQGQFEQFRRICASYTRVSNCLQQRAEKITQLLANTLSFREQANAKAQSETMLRLNKSAVFITTITLLYLPPSFVATFFGMSFFDFDEEMNRIVVTPMIWIFALCSVILTVGTFLSYDFLLDRTFVRYFGRKVASMKRSIRLKTGNSTDGTELEFV